MAPNGGNNSDFSTGYHYQRDKPIGHGAFGIVW